MPEEVSEEVWYDKLLKKYPKTLKGITYFECGVGWYDLLQKLCSVLEHHIARLPEEIRDDVYAVQIKEKFGSLRFYMNQQTPYISGAISLAESLSAITCEACGKPGKPSSSGWIRTLCEEHQNI